MSREQGTCSCLGLRVVRSAEELIIVVVIVNAAAAASSESHSFNRFIVFAFAAANTTALTEYVAERRAGDIERYSQQEHSRGDCPSAHHYVLALLVICTDRVLSRSRGHILQGPAEDARERASDDRADTLLLQPHTRLGGAAARAGDPGLGEAARRELESARRGRSGVCAEEQGGAAGGRRRGEGRVRVRRGVRAGSFSLRRFQVLLHIFLCVGVGQRRLRER